LGLDFEISGCGEVVVKGESFAKSSFSHHFKAAGVCEGVHPFIMSPELDQSTNFKDHEKSETETRRVNPDLRIVRAWVRPPAA